ncbi:hypothetical protein ACIQTW_21455 [Paenarthrobacter sp. NPDC090517]|uniref:hypothetical protein n=1 Tax=Paenarthrobacter sp. NPDC090517 TaxID=3364381 RepID=UPI0037FACD2D
MHVLATVPAFAAGTVFLKLSDDDVFLAWTGIVIPAAAAVASVLVAAISVRIASRAKRIAEDSETARREDQSHREDFERTLRFDAALKSLYLGIAARIEALVEQDAVVRTVAFNLASSGKPEVALASKPPLSSLLALFAAAALDASSDEEEELLEIGAAVVISAAEEAELEPKMDSPAAREANLRLQVHRLDGLMLFIKEWRVAGPDDRRRMLDSMDPDLH